MFFPWSRHDADRRLRAELKAGASRRRCAEGDEVHAADTPPGGGRLATAVLVPIVDGTANGVILTQRQARTLRRHRQDRLSPAEARSRGRGRSRGLRDAEEEIGLPAWR